MNATSSFHATTRYALHGNVVDDEGATLSAGELGQACRVTTRQVELWVVEGVLQPSGGQAPDEWRFGGSALRRMRAAERLRRDLELDPPAVALALDLLDRIALLEARLRRAGLEIGR